MCLKQRGLGVLPLMDMKKSLGVGLRPLAEVSLKWGIGLQFPTDSFVV